MTRTSQGRYITLFLLICFIIAGCDSISPNNEPETPSLSKNGFRAKVSGIPGEAARDLEGGLKTRAARNEEYLGQAFDGAFIMLDATKEDGMPEYISFFHSTFETLEVKSYEIGGWTWTGEDSTAFPDLPEFFADYVRTVDNEERLYPASSGSITITSITDESIEGTFSFESTMFYGYTLPNYDGEDPSGLEDYHFEAREVTLDEPLKVEGSFKAEVVTFDDFCIIYIEEDGPESTSDEDCSDYDDDYDYEEMEFDRERFGSEYFIYSEVYAEYVDSSGVDTTLYSGPELNDSNLEALVYPFCAGGSFEVRSEIVNG